MDLASRIFTMLFALLKPVLSARTLSKIQIYNSPSKWKPVLQRDLPLKELPVEFGGCKFGRRISIGSTPHVDKGLADGIAYLNLKVGAGQKIDLVFDIRNPNTILTWKFKTDSFDIGFSVTRDRKDQVYAYKRCDSHVTEEADEIICVKPGEYFLSFDNSHNQIQEKTVHYFIDILDRTEDEKILEADE